ncbi:MAG: response regulator transcription factor [Lachnospiraceae bacterium]|nr:response regulator transcription factor [Lachnospiraceae bacterium]
MGKRVLIVDDEKLIVKGLRISLEHDDIEVDCAYDGEEALALARDNEYDMIFLDVMLPKLSGFEVCQEIREFSNVPIIMLTAKGDDMDKILGLEYGADDYITKPFNIMEVKARMKAIMRRSVKKSVETKKTSGINIDRANRSVYIGDKEVDLTAKEFDLIDLFVHNPKTVYSRKDLLKLIWGTDSTSADQERKVDVHIRRLREKIEPNPENPKYVHTKWGKGYFYQD